ncbi:MAG: restriction endonuclease subunit S [Clostridiales bacterium]|nr:restriction endonuclease subunit S [Clostridiales bacterium]
MREMKDSGIEWVGQIPKGWNRSKLLYCLRQPICDGPHETPDYLDDGIPFISVDSLNESKRVDLTQVKRFISEHDYRMYMQKAKIEKGDILFSKAATIGKTAIVDDEVFMVWSPLAIIKRDKNRIDNDYLYYLLNCDALIDAIRLSGSFNTQANVGMREMERAIIPIPCQTEQRRIADSLDAKCAEIDALTADIEKHIETLEQYKRSVITEAVTKGLNPDVEMKDSGIEWVGQIPKSWSIHPVYYYFNERKNTNYALKEQNLLSLSYGRIIRKDINAVGGLLPASFSTYNIVESGDIIIRPTDLQNDKRSLRTGLANERGIITSAYIDLAPKSGIYSRFFHYLLHSYDVQKVFYNMGNGVRQGLNYSEFSKLKVFAPSITEQADIVAFLDEMCEEINTTITQKQKQLEALSEYKKSLIYEYVTGKKEVISS